MKTLRLARLREEMAAQGIRQLILTQEQHLFYLTGVWVQPHDRLDALVIRENSCTALCYSLAVLETEGCDTVIYSDTGKTVDTLASLLDPVPTGVDPRLQSRFLLPLMEKRKDIRWTLSNCAESVRTIKDPEEIACLKTASEVTDRVFEAAFQQIHAGMTELEAGKVFSACFDREGCGLFPGNPMVAFGPGTAQPHHVPGNYALQRGDALYADTGMRIHDYYSDMTRTAFCGSVSDEQKHVYEAVLAANEAGIRAVRPGVLYSDVRRAALKELEHAGVGPCPHRISHGIGIDYHEEPFDTEDHEIVLRPGMCFSVEPGVYLPGRFGIRIEDLVAVTEDGCCLLSHAPKALRILD